MITKAKYKKYAESLAVSAIQELTPAERADAERLVREAWDILEKLRETLIMNVWRAANAIEKGDDAEEWNKLLDDSAKVCGEVFK